MSKLEYTKDKAYDLMQKGYAMNNPTKSATYRMVGKTILWKSNLYPWHEKGVWHDTNIHDKDEWMKRILWVLGWEIAPKRKATKTNI